MDVFSLVLLALYNIAGGVMGTGWSNHMSPNENGFLTDEELAMYNFSMVIRNEFESLQMCGVTCPAMDGCQSEVVGRLDEGHWLSSPSCSGVKSSWFEFFTLNVDVADSLCSSLSFLAMMALLGALLASNVLSFNVLAVIGGQEMSVAVLNSLLGVVFCFKQLQKQKHAWKQKSRLERRKSRLGQRQLMRQMQVLIWFSLMSNCWTMDVGVAQQIAELAQAATRAAQAATTVAEKFGSKGMSAGCEILPHSG